MALQNPSLETSFQKTVEQRMESLLHTALALPLSSRERQLWVKTFVEVENWVIGKRNCAGCRTPVRDAMNVISIDDDGSKREYDCLCRRCLEAEKIFARRVALYVDGAFFQEFINTKPAVARPTPVKVPAAA